jgi:hypothetical protein
MRINKDALRCGHIYKCPRGISGHFGAGGDWDCKPCKETAEISKWAIGKPSTRAESDDVRLNAVAEMRKLIEEE